VREEREKSGTDSAQPCFGRANRIDTSGRGTMNLHPLLRSLAHRNYRLYFIGQGISLIGTWMQQIAMSWLVFQMTQSSFQLSIVLFAGQIPALFLGLAGAFDHHAPQWPVVPGGCWFLRSAPAALARVGAA
jgi:hypothetical protein